VKILTKVWYTHLGYERTKHSVYQSLTNLGRDSIDIVILHWPRCNDEIEWMNCDAEEAGECSPHRHARIVLAHASSF
jgi:diketogulonate reductase-like aldo/keto reductase